jgi:hypothetical protein
MVLFLELYSVKGLSHEMNLTSFVDIRSTRPQPSTEDGAIIIFECSIITLKVCFPRLMRWLIKN